MSVKPIFVLLLLAAAACAEDAQAPEAEQHSFRWKLPTENEPLSYEVTERTDRVIRGRPRAWVSTETTRWRLERGEPQEDVELPVVATLVAFEWEDSVEREEDERAPTAGSFRRLPNLVGETLAFESGSLGGCWNLDDAIEDARHQGGSFAEGFREGALQQVEERFGSDVAPWKLARWFPQQVARLLEDPVEIGKGWYVLRPVYDMSHSDHEIVYTLEAVRDEDGRQLADCSVQGGSYVLEAGDFEAEAPANRNLVPKRSSCEGRMTFDLTRGCMVELELTITIHGSLIDTTKTLTYTLQPESQSENEEDR